MWAPRDRRGRAIGWFGAGLLLGLLPILIWNSQHEWASILYQIRDRHGGESLSVVRWLKFWLVEMVFAGPVVVGYFFVLVRNSFSPQVTSRTRAEKFLWVWIWPAAAVFCCQPLFAAFKPHWAFVVWWPVILGLALNQGSFRKRWIRLQIGYGNTLILLIALSCHLPWLGRVVPLVTHAPFQMTWDVTNDFYGWSHLKSQMSAALNPSDLTLPIVGSRYQTASQAAFSLAGFSQVTLLPRDLKERDEWPDLRVSKLQGPSWPKLERSVLFVADNRYSESPQFEDAQCAKLARFEQFRWGQLAKWIELWKCVPGF